MGKINVTIRVQEEVVEEAKEVGLNISRTCENALKQAIKQLKPLYSQGNPEDCSNSCSKKSLVRGVGFEPTNPYRTAASGLRL